MPSAARVPEILPAKEPVTLPARWDDSDRADIRHKVGDDQLKCGTLSKEAGLPHSFQGHEKPWYCGLVLVLAICAVSSAGGVFKEMAGAAPISRAGWRLQATSLALTPGAAVQWWNLQPDLRQRLSLRPTWYILSASGTCLALHFGLWVWSLDHTSLPHSLLLVCSTPLVVALLMLLRGQRLSRGELGGVALGFTGSIVLAATKSTDQEVGLLGDLAAFGAATAFVGYITAGKHCREWMPLFVYVQPVTLVGAVWLSLGGVVLEGWGATKSSQVAGPLTWLTTGFFWPTLYLALGPGIVGHTGLNAVLRYMSPLGVSMAVSIEPMLGSAIGWALGVSTAPGVWTWVGGCLLVTAMVLVDWAGERRNREAAKANEMALGGPTQEVEMSEDACLRDVEASHPPKLPRAQAEDAEESSEEKALLRRDGD